MTVFVDTSALYALLSADDQNHAAAAAALRRLTASADRLLTHNYVIVETAALVQRRLGPAAVRALLDDLLAPIELVCVDEHVHRAATAALLASGSRDISLVDWASFEIMRGLGIGRALAFDDDFAAQGFELLASDGS